ncbi:hypothetical protein H8E88_10290 [candidate division KSB1 bacterium]|nr:hypothetical protein [candidate division KSB1 bacterium]
MSYLRSDFPGLWFQIYKKVLRLNEKLEKDRLDKSSLREVVTSIFIASTHKGIVKPKPETKFISEMAMLIESVSDREKQEQIFKTVKEIISNGRHYVQPKDKRKVNTDPVSHR